MKKIIYLILLVSMFSCQKEFKSVNDNRTNYLKQIDGYLKVNMLPQDYSQVELDKSVIDTAVAIQKLFTRVPFKNKPANTDFIMLETDFSGVNSSGKIISLPKEFYTTFPFTGTIQTNNLSRTNPQGLQTHKKTVSNVQNVLPEPTTLPGVTVTAYVNDGAGYSYVNWLVASSVTFGTSGNSPIPYTSGSGVSNGTTYFAYYIDPNNKSSGSAYAVENDYSDYYTGEDINKIFNCFNQIPDAGAIYSLKICADLPNNLDPYDPINNTHPGHAFLILTKTNGSQSVTKAFGFYPQNGSKSILLNPVASKIVNDFNHEINGSLIMNNLTQANFNTIKAKAIQLASSQYDLDDFNCADYAVNVFNSARPNNPLILGTFFGFIAALPLPTLTFSMKNSPNMLYKKISDILESGVGEWQNAKIDGSHNYRSPNTTGGCN